MVPKNRMRWRGTPPLRWVWLCAALFLLSSYAAQAQVPYKTVAEVRTVYADQGGIGYPISLAYLTTLNQFFLWQKAGPTQATVGESTLTIFTPYEDLVDTVHLPPTLADASTITFDDATQRLFLLKDDLTTLIQIPLGSNGALASATETHFPLANLGLQSAKGMAIDAAGKSLFILDGAAAQIVIIPLQEQLDPAAFTKVDLPPELGMLSAQGLGVNPSNHHLYLMQPNQHVLYELTQAGQLVAQYDLAPLLLTNPLALVFAPSADLTDAPNTVHLFLVDSPASEPQASTGKVIEVALDSAEATVSAASPSVTTLTLVQTVHTSAFSPPSPDPSGITYLPATDLLLISDSEVDEMPPYFQGFNLFGVTRAGGLAYTKSTTTYTNEPTDLAYNANNGHLFVSSDSQKRVFDVNPGPDGVLYTSDDTRTFFSTSAFNSMDPEGLDYDAGSGHLFIADGVNSEVYRVNPGPNGVFDGLPANGGDDSVTQFDTAVHNILDPEGIDYVPETGHLLLTGKNNVRLLYEVSTAGSWVQTFDVSAANSKKLAGVVMAPSSTDASRMSYYLVDRGIDNDSDPQENDGKLYEFASGSNASTATPTNTPTRTPTNTPGPTPTPTHTPIPTGGDIIYVSSTSGGTVGSVKFADEDVLAYNTSTGIWAMYFDGSDVLPTTLDVDGLARLSDGSLLLSFDVAGNISGLGMVDDSDIVRFIPTSLGSTTAGSFAWYFQGADVGLTADSEDIDALAILSNNRLVVSTIGALGATGLTSVVDEDLVLFTPTQLGQTTSGAWSLYFEGSDVGLNTSGTEDVNGTWIDPATGELYLTTNGDFTVPGVSGDGSDIFICTPGSLGATTSCTFRLYWDGSAHGFGGEVTDALEIVKGGQQANAATLSPLDNTTHDGQGDDPLADSDEGPDDVDDAAQEHQLFLPLIQQ
jgi:hypothetical protein